MLCFNRSAFLLRGEHDPMSRSNSGWSSRFRNTVGHWFQSRMQECIHCRACESTIPPFVTYCPKCGQVNPTRVANSAVIYLVIGFVYLAFTLSALVAVF